MTSCRRAIIRSVPRMGTRGLAGTRGPAGTRGLAAGPRPTITCCCSSQPACGLVTSSLSDSERQSGVEFNRRAWSSDGDAPATGEHTSPARASRPSPLRSNLPLSRIVPSPPSPFPPTFFALSLTFPTVQLERLGNAVSSR